jgi:hypothetical protein
MNDNIKEKIRQALYSSTNLNINTDVGVKQYVTNDNNFAKKVCSIEKTMREIVESDQVLFSVFIEKAHPKKIFQPTKLGKALLACIRGNIFDIRQHFPIHRFNPYVELLMRHSERGKYSALRLKECFINSDEADAQVKFANRFVELIRKQARTVAFKKAKSDHIRSANKNYKALVKYIVALFKKYARLLVLRIDLSYLSRYGWPYGEEPVTPIQFKTHRKQLMKVRIPAIVTDDSGRS